MPNGAHCSFLYTVHSFPILSAGGASLPRGKGRDKLPERHTCCVPAALGDAFPIRTICPGNKDWISLLKKNSNLETNCFILKDAAGHTKSCLKSTELTSTYTVLVGNWVGAELTKSPHLSSVTGGESRGA